MPPGSGAGTGEGDTPYHRREVETRGTWRARARARSAFGTERANSTNSAGDLHAPNAERAAAAIDCTRPASLSPLHWLQQRCAARMFAGSIALPPLEIGTISSSSSAYGWRAGSEQSMGMPHIQQRCGCDAMRRRRDERAL